MQPTVSVIVPMYKVERYLMQALDAIIHQTLSNIEIILVDDGSPDRCGEIAERYAQKDSRIKVIHQSNQGLSKARNAGMNMATGEYISFVDSDDWVELDMLERLYEIAFQHQCDVVAFDFYIEQDYKRRCVSSCCTTSVLESKEAIIKSVFIPLILQGKGSANAWKMLYRRELLTKQRIIFKSLEPIEDYVFNMEVLANAERFLYIKHPFYHYRILGNSLSRRFHSGLFDTLIKVLQFKEDQMRKLGLDTFEYDAFHVHWFMAYAKKMILFEFAYQNKEPLSNKISRIRRLVHHEKTHKIIKRGWISGVKTPFVLLVRIKAVYGLVIAAILWGTLYQLKNKLIR